MTFVGKVLVVVQLVLSVCFMAFAGAVYTAETNWRQRSLALVAERDRIRTEMTDQNDILQKSVTEKERIAGELKDQVATLDNKVRDAEDARLRLTTELEAARTAVDQQTALANIAEEQATARREEALRQRERNELLHTQVNQQLDKTRQLEDELFAKNLSIDAMNVKQARLISEISDLRGRLAGQAVANVGGQPGYTALDDSTPPDVTGRVLETRKSPTSNTEFVEISLGGDDGFRRGNELFVYRGDSYVGKIQLESVTPDRAVGRVTQRARNGQIQKGDYVTSKL